SPLVRFDLWDSGLYESPGHPPVPLLSRTDCLGAALLSGLARRAAETSDARAVEERPPPESLRLAGGAFALDRRGGRGHAWRRWGPAYAWRRLRRAWREALADAAVLCHDLVRAEGELRQCVTEHARRLCAALLRFGAAEGRRFVLLGPLFHGRDFCSVVRSVF